MPRITDSPALPLPLQPTDRLYVERGGSGPFEVPLSEIGNLLDAAPAGHTHSLESLGAAAASHTHTANQVAGLGPVATMTLAEAQAAVSGGGVAVTAAQKTVLGSNDSAPLVQNLTTFETLDGYGTLPEIHVPASFNAVQINNLLASAPAGSVVVFRKNANYQLSAPLYYSGKYLHLRGNGATLKLDDAVYTTGFAGSILQIGEWETQGTISSGTLASPIELTEGQYSIDIPVGAPLPQAGDVIKLMSLTDLLQSVGTYYHGYTTIVQSVTGRTVVLLDPSYGVFTCDKFVIFRGYQGKSSVCGFKFDQSNHPNIVDISTRALSAFGSSIDIHSNKFVGNQYAQRAILVHGYSASVHHNKITNFQNSQGLVGGGRVGYGVSTDADKTRVYKNEIDDCKHSVTTAARYLAVGVFDVYQNDIVETQSGDPTTFVGSIDAHAGVYGTPRIFKNNIKSIGHVFQIRCGRARIRNNDVTRLANVAMPALAMSETAPVDIEMAGNTIRQKPLNDLISNVFSAPVVFAGVKVHRNNVVDGGGVVNLGSIAGVAGLVISGNTFKNLDRPLAAIALPTAALADGVSIVENQVKTRGVGFDVISLLGPGLSDATSSYANVEIRDNVGIDAISLGAGGGYIVTLADTSFSNTKITGNTGKRSDTRGFQIRRSSLTDFSFFGNKFPDTQVSISSAGTPMIFTRTEFAYSSIQALLMFEGAGDIRFFEFSIHHNTIDWTASTTRPLSFTPRSGSGSMGFSREVRVAHNTVRNGSGTACITMGSFATGHKWYFHDNILSSPIEDLSLTYYKVAKNTVTSGTPQPWKGGTTCNDSGVLFSAAAPTTGTWAVGEEITFPAPAAGGYMGAVCVTAGTPGTWKSCRPISA